MKDSQFTSTPHMQRCTTIHSLRLLPILTEYNITGRVFHSLFVSDGNTRTGELELERKHCHHLKLPLDSLYTRHPYTLSLFSSAFLFNFISPSLILPLALSPFGAVTPAYIYIFFSIYLTYIIAFSLFFSLILLLTCKYCISYCLPQHFPVLFLDTLPHVYSLSPPSLFPYVPTFLSLFVPLCIHLCRLGTPGIKGPFQSDYFGHAPEFVIFFPPSFTLPSLALHTA